MDYYFSKELKNISFEDAIEKVTQELKKEGFGVLTEINVKDTLKKKLDIDFKRYQILGACNPTFAHKALQVEDKIGVMLPCNVIVEENENGTIEIAAINPVASMQAVKNKNLGEIGIKIKEKLQRVIDEI